MTWQPLSHQDYVHACWESTFKHRVTFTSHLALSPWWLWKHHSDTNANPACFLSSQFLTFVLLVLHLCVSIARAHISTATPTWNSTPGRLVHCPQTKRLLSVLALPATFNVAGMTQTRKRLTRRQPLSTAFRSPTATKACSQSSSAQTRRGCSWHPVWCLDAAGSAPELSQASGIRQKHFPHPRTSPYGRFLCQVLLHPSFLSQGKVLHSPMALVPTWHLHTADVRAPALVTHYSNTWWLAAKPSSRASRAPLCRRLPWAAGAFSGTRLATLWLLPHV